MKNISVVFTPHPPVIIPTIGGGREKEVQKTIEGMNELGQLIGEIKPKTIIYITPHGNSFHNGTCILDKDILNGDFTNFGFPEIKFSKPINNTLSKKIYDELENAGFTSILMDEKLSNQYNVNLSLDHGVMVPMYFIDKYYDNYNIVHITPGLTPLEENYKLGKCIRDVVKDEVEKSTDILIVCSGDLSHALKDEGPYDYDPMGAIFDEKVKDAITNLNPMSLITLDNKIIDDAKQCGLRSYLMGFGFLDGIGFNSKIISYEGTFGVGYLTGYLDQDSKVNNPSLLEKIENYNLQKYEHKISKEDDYIKLARKSIETYIKHNTKLDINKVKKEFNEDFILRNEKKRVGAFVSIHSHGSLRGCIGTILSTKESIID